MTYTLCGTLKHVNTNNKENIIQKVNMIAEKYGFGIKFKLSEIFQEERELLEQLIDENSIPFYLTYSPKNPEGHDILCKDLGSPPFKNKNQQSRKGITFFKKRIKYPPENKGHSSNRVIDFFKEVWNLNEVSGAIFVVWDLATDVECLPSKEGRIEDFFKFLENWWRPDYEEDELIFEAFKIEKE